MHIRREPHLGDERDASTRNADRIGLFEGQLKVRRFDGFRYFLAQFRKKLGNNAISGEPLPVFRFEELFSNNAVGIDEKVSRASKALLHPRSFLIEDAISLDGLRLTVPEHRVLNLVPVSKKFQDFFRVIANGRELDSLLFKSRERALQLDQLPFAEGSPVCGTEKEKNGAVCSFEGIESLHAVKLVVERKGWSFLTDRESDRHQLDGSYVNRSAIKRAVDGYAISQVGGYRLLGLKAVHDPVRIVKERQLRTRHVLGAVRNFGKGFICIATARHECAGPRTGFCCAVLPRQCEGSYGKKRYQIKEETFHNRISSDHSINSRPFIFILDSAHTVRLIVSARNVYQTLIERYGSREFAVVGFKFDTMTDTEDPVVFAKKIGVRYPLAVASDDLKQKFGGIGGLPTTMLYDRQGILRKKVIGFEYTATFETDLQSLL